MLSAALCLRLKGIQWPPYHPDEPVIAQWLLNGEPDRAYPGGFFTLAKPLRFAWERIEHARHQLAVFKGVTSELIPSQPNFLLMARYINVFLATLTCLVIYFGAKALSGSRTYGLISATLLAVSQYHVEHSHYAESDIAMVFALSVALAAWLQFLRTERTSWFGFAAFALGFAGGTKFTLVSLWPALLIFPIIGKKPPQFSNVWKWRALGLFLAALLLIFGFVAATPAVTDWREFWNSAAIEAARVYRETRLNMGPLAADTAVRLTARVHDLARWSASLGIPWLTLWALSLPMLFVPEGRRAWIPLALSPALFIWYWVFKSPWVRTQEFMVFLPFAALTAPWAPWYVWRNGNRAARCIVAAACLAACCFAAARGLRTASIFGWTDTRDMATRWLALCAPDHATYAKEKHSDASPPSGAVIPIRMVAHHTVTDLRQRGIDFVLRNGAAGDRGMVHPVTGLRYDFFEQRYNEFLSASELLKVWAPLPPPDTLTTFNSIRMEIYGMPRHRTWPTMARPLYQPAFITHRERWTFFPRGRHLGPATAMELTPDGVTCGIGGPDELPAPVYAVVYTFERPAVVVLKGMGRRWTIRLNPYDARVVPMLRPAWKPRFSHFERVTARVIPRPNIYRVPCYLQIAFSRAEARRILQDLGFTAPPDLGIGGGFQSNLRHIEQLEPLMVQPVEQFGVGPNSAWYYNQFARLRITNNVAIEWQTAEPASTEPARARILLPVMQGPLPCTLTLNAMVEPATDPLVVATFYNAADSSRLLATTLVAGATNRIALPVRTDRMAPLALTVEMPHPLLRRVERAELTWDIHSALRQEIANLRLALAEQSLSRGDRNDALKQLDELPSELPALAELRRRKIRWKATVNDRTEACRDAARALLEMAPHHVGALETLAMSDVHAATALEKIRQFPKRNPLRLHRFGALRGALVNDDHTAVAVLIEITEDLPPPLAVRVYTRRHGRWKATEGPGAVATLPAQCGEGECIVLSLALPPAKNLTAIALGVESHVRWHAGRLAADGYEDGIIPLKHLLGEP